MVENMNERIRELARQAGATDEQGSRSESVFCFTKQELDGFAELLIQECVDIIGRESEKAIRNNTYMGDDVPASVTQWAIKKHFGVEE